MNRCARPLTRRTMLSGAFGFGLGVQRATWTRPASAAVDSLRMLCWPGYDSREVTRDFRDAARVEIVSQRIGANDEIFTFLRAGGIGRFDLVTPSDGVVQALAAAGLIQPIDPGRLANLGQLLPRFQSPPWAQYNGQLVAVPLSWHTAPMIYNVDALPDPPASWTDLLGAEFKGRVVMTDDVLGHFLTWNRAFGASNPARVSKTVLEETVQNLIAIKRDLAAAFAGNMDEVAREIASGRSWVSTTGMEIVPALAGARGVNVRIAHPAPGDFSVCDAICLVADAPNPDAAYAFIDHMIESRTQATLANSMQRGTTNALAVSSLEDGVRSLYSYDDLDAVFAVSPLTGFPPLEAAAGEIATYVDWVVAWDRIRYTRMNALSTPTPSPTAAATAVAS